MQVQYKEQSIYIRKQIERQSKELQRSIQQYAGMMSSRLDELMEQIQGKKASSNNNDGLEVNNIPGSMEIGVPKFDGKDSNGSIVQEEDYLLFSRPAMAASSIARASSDDGPAIASNGLAFASIGLKWNSLTAQAQNPQNNLPNVSPNTSLLVQYPTIEHRRTPHTPHHQSPPSTQPPLPTRGSSKALSGDNPPLRAKPYTEKLNYGPENDNISGSKKMVVSGGIQRVSTLDRALPVDERVELEPIKARDRSHHAFPTVSLIFRWWGLPTAVSMVIILQK